MNREQIKALTDQELADAAQAAIWRAKRLLDEGLRRACSSDAADEVVPPLSLALGAVTSAHGYSTAAANAMPTVAPKFGDK